MYPEQVNNNYEGDGVLLYGLQGTSFYKETKENKIMKQLIDKSALVAEIEKRLEAIANASPEDNKQFAAIRGAQHYELISLVRFINTLETKEVDLEKEIDKIWNPRFNLGWDEKSLLSMNHEGFTTIAKHFYELGLKTQQGE